MEHITLPLVIDEYLFLYGHTQDEDDACTVPVGSKVWHIWLAEEQHASFSFKCRTGSFTARCERQRNGWYWYAYRKRDRKLHKAYLGKSEELTLERLNDAAATLAFKAGTRDSKQAPISEQQTLPVSLFSHYIPATKFSIPSSPASIVARPRLNDRVDTIMKKKLLIVSAPSGWGKTTLLSAWCSWHHHDFPIIWISLDASDNNPLAFWSHMIMALNTIQPGLANSTVELLYKSKPSSIEPVLNILLKALSRLSTDTVLILDDYHSIETPSIHRSLTFFLDHLPPRLHLIISSRVEPPLSLPKFRMQGSVVELHTAELHFTHMETLAFLNQHLENPIVTEIDTSPETYTDSRETGLHFSTQIHDNIFRNIVDQRSAEPAPLHPLSTSDQFAKLFTRREHEVLKLLIHGASNREIAQSLVLSEGTVKKHISNICSKLGVQSRTRVIAKYISQSHGNADISKALIE